jgi:hypothetical protein
MPKIYATTMTKFCEEKVVPPVIAFSQTKQQLFMAWRATP